MSELLLVAVPGIDVDASGALLRVVMVPRLTGPGTTVGSYGLADWPELVRGAELVVHLRGDDGSELSPFGAAVASDGDSAVWKTFFPSHLAVQPYAGQRTYDDPVVRATSTEAGDVTRLYREVATNPGDPSLVRVRLRSLKITEAGDHPADVTAPIPTFEPPDLHRALALLREHPHVLRALGLIVDLRIPVDRLAAAGDLGQIRLSWPGAPAGVGAATGPPTAYEHLDGRFLPRSTRTVVAGLVDLQSRSDVTVTDRVTGVSTTQRVPDWVVTTVDVDAAMARLSDAKAVAVSGHDDAVTRGLPPLRTAGLVLLRRGRGAELAWRASRGRAAATRAATDKAPPLTAEDLVLGYRIDVREPGHEWHSLTRRVATYRVAPQPVTAGPVVTIGAARRSEEGHVKPAAGALGTDGVLRADETVVRWAGHHLALAPPDPAPGPARAAHHPDPRMPYHFTWALEEDPEAPPDLPLSFGSQYQLRARVVDIAGGGLGVADPPRDRAATSPVTYARQEPAAPPVIPPPDGLLTTVAGAPRADPDFFGPGGSIDVLVVRSDPAGDPPGANLSSGYPANAMRTLLPPPTSLPLAEQHGRLADDSAVTVHHVRRALAPPRSSASPRNGRHYTWLPDPVVDGVTVVAVPLAPDRDPSPPAIEAWGTESWPDYKAKGIALEPVPAGEPIRAEWDGGGTVSVSLPAGEEAFVEISSSLVDNTLQHFAAGLWLLGNQSLVTDANTGRHPVVTPALTLRAVHAVRRPLGTPSADLVVSRSVGDTAATLTGAANAAFGVHVASTGQVDVTASWDEWGDSDLPTPRSEVVESLPVGLDRTPLPAIRHQFADTKYRRIRYTLTAWSRFRAYFRADDPDEAFAASTTLAPVDVLSSARPQPPVVLSVVPAARWHDDAPEPLPITTGELGPEDGTVPQDDPDREAPTVRGDPSDEERPFRTRVRHGGRLQVELAGPWHSTGEGEQLAIVVAAEPPPDPSSVLWSEVTTVYSDPVYSVGTAPAQPTEGSLASPFLPVVHATDAGSGREVAILPVAVRHHDGRPYADVMLPMTQQTYCPLVRLAVARYQPHSLPGLELSAIVMTEVVAVLPTRTLVVDRPPGGVTVRLSGVGPESGANVVAARLEVAPAQGFAGTLSSLGAETSELGWREVSTVTGGLDAALPVLPVPADGRTYRVVVTEVEPLTPLPGPAPTDPLASALGRRVVFADVVDL